jgi:hypothetical protein
MARGKPLILSKKPGSKVREERKRKAEEAFQSGTLPQGPPVELRGMPAAQKAWRKLKKAHDQLPGQLFNGLDRGFLIGYCLAVQARQRALDLEGEARKRFEERSFALEDLIKVRTELRMATRLVADLEKQLYATPKSRGGISPEPRELTAEELVKRELQDLDY